MKFTSIKQFSERVAANSGRAKISNADAKVATQSRLNRVRHESNFTHPYFAYSGLTEFENSDPIVHSRCTGAIWVNGLPIDFYLDIRKSAPLVVFFNGAGQPEMRLPWFAGNSVSSGLEISRLSISDPSLYLDPSLNLAWYAGNEYQPFLHKTLARVVTHIANSTDAPKVILIGGSGGGFASMMVASQLPSSTAIVMNPQTSIERYHPMHRRKYIDIAWQGSSSLFHKAAEVGVGREVGQSVGKLTILYMQNLSDTFHVKNHLTPFRAAFRSAPEMWLMLERWRDGHTPPPKDVISSTLSAAITSDPKTYGPLGFSPL
ncbi:hypothetical protein [Corynebacterium afermentans]|uniref:hypothetical protein n=1 Tax=Corynebacterium afermentans TaxID=38286 RepID=UPI0025748A47|nr:hypothetical protein [Corynebacterium afermentans]